MKKNIIWKIILFVGIIPFIVPFAWGFYSILVESWSLLDWMILYSAIYWPTYVVGLMLIIISVFMLIRLKSRMK